MIRPCTQIQTISLMQQLNRFLLNLTRFTSTLRIGDPVARAQTRSHAVNPAKRRALIDTGRTLADAGLAFSGLGEISLRLAENRLLVSTSGADLRNLDQQLIQCDVTGSTPERSPAGLAWHRLVYAHSRSQAVILCQPPHAMLVAGADLPLEADWSPEIYALLGGVLRFSGSAASIELPEMLARNACILRAGQGVVIRAEDPTEALRRVEALEYLSRLALLAYGGGLSPRRR